MFAIIETGGKQYKVEQGARVVVERLDAGPGETVEFDRVLMIGGDGPATVGTPAIQGAKVLAFVVSQGRADKVTVFKYKAKSNYRRKTGHRQPETHVRITEIVAAAPAPRRPRGRTAARAPATPRDEGSAEQNEGASAC